jgi:hypothetical protein
LWQWQVDHRKNFGGGGSSVESFNPYKGTGVRDLYKQLGSWVGPQIGQSVTPYSGQTVADFSNLQNQGFAQAGQLGTTSNLMQNYAQQAMQQQLSGGNQYQQMATSALQDIMKPYDATSATNYWNQSFVNPAMQNWQQNVLPTIAEKYGTGGVGGSLGREMLRSGENLNTNLSGQLGDILYSGQQADLTRKQTGVNQAMGMAGLSNQLMSGAGNIAGQGTDMLSQMMNMGSMQQAQSQNQLNAAQNYWTQSQPYSNPYLQQFLGTALQQGGNQAMVKQNAPGIGTQMLPMLGAMAGMGLVASGAGGALLGGAGSALSGLGTSIFGGATGGFTADMAAETTPGLLGSAWEGIGSLLALL